MSSDEFKNKIESFLQNISAKICQSDILEQIQNEYNQLMDIYGKLTIMSNEELEGIENEITNLNSEINKLAAENESLKATMRNQELKFKIETDKTEGLKEKIKILQNTLESYSDKSAETEGMIIKLNNMITELRNDNSNLVDKYHSLLDEMEINNKNVKKNFTLELTIKELTEEKEKMSQTIRTFNNSEDYKIKLLQAHSELKEVNEKFNIIHNSFIQCKSDNEKLSNENFNKYNIINTLENENKIKNYKLEELDKENKLIIKQLTEYENKLKEADHSIKIKKSSSDNQIKELKKEMDKLIKLNESLKKENVDSNEKLKNLQQYTNFAKTSKELLSKKDFSILETMSRRVEELNDLNENLRVHVQSLGIENDFLKSKVSYLENLTFYYMKDDLESMKKRNYDTNFPEEELIAVRTLTQNSENVKETILLLKKENFNLHKQLEDISVECNQLLRGSSTSFK